MIEFFDVIRKCPLFNEISDFELDTLLDCLGAENEHFGKKETIIREGSPALDICILLSGSAQIIKVDHAGNRSIVANVEPSELFGESFACAEIDSMPISVVAAEDCDVLFIDRRRFNNACARDCAFHNQVIYNLMRINAVKNLQFREKLEILSKRTTRDRLMAYLEFKAKEQNSSTVTVPFDRQELADYLEVDRSGLSSEISKLKKEGIINCEKDRFELL